MTCGHSAGTLACMSATEEQMFPSRITARLFAWLAPLLFLFAALAAVPVSATASAKALCVPQNRIGEHSAADAFTFSLSNRAIGPEEMKFYEQMQKGSAAAAYANPVGQTVGMIDPAAIVKGVATRVAEKVGAKEVDKIGAKAVENLGKKAAAKSMPELGKKLDYPLGKAAGSAHNLQRSADMLRQLESIGLPDSAATRRLLSDHLTEVLNNPSNIVRIQENRRIVRESLLMGPKGGVKLETVWERNKLITVHIYGGK